MDNRTPKQIVDEMVEAAHKQGGTLTELSVPTEFYRELAIECSPKTVEETYGFPITVDTYLDQEGSEELEFRSATLH